MKRKEIIKLEKVTFSYGKDEFLKDINLPIYDDDFLGIIGPNGGGKTTILKLILGLIKPKKGKVSVFGEPPQKTRHEVGYLSQFSHCFFNSFFVFS
jgi:zinc transport system ATP-binding protein